MAKAPEWKLEQRPRDRWGRYGFKARVPSVGRAPTFRAATLREARRAAEIWAEGVLTGKVRTSPETTLAEYWATVVASQSSSWRPGTRNNRQSIWRQYLEPRFGPDPLSTIGRIEIKEWIGELRDAGVTTHRCRTVLADLKALLNQAVLDGLISHAPMTKGLLPPKDPSAGQALSPSQARLLVGSVHPRYQALIFLLLTAGLRVSEALALKMDDIDFAARTISVTKTMGLDSYEPFIGPPKTRAGRRIVPVLPKLLAVLENHVSQFGTSPEGYIFTAMRQQKWLRYPGIHRHFRRVVRQLVEEHEGFPSIRIHDLRKTYGSNLLRGVSSTEAAKIMGHARPSITHDAIRHLFPERKRLQQLLRRWCGV
jgi:integrase